MSNTTILILGILLAGFGLLVVVSWIRNRRSKHAPQLILQSWDEVRNEALCEASDSPRPPIPNRPPNLDCRLDKKLLDTLRNDWRPNDKAVGKAWAIYHILYKSIDDELAQINHDDNWAYEPISDARRAVHVSYVFEQRVAGGGLESYFLNPSGDGAWSVLAAFELMNDLEAAAFCAEVNSYFPDGPKPYRPNRLLQMSRFGEREIEFLETSTKRYFAMQSNRMNGNVAFQCAIPFVLKNHTEFFRET